MQWLIDLFRKFFPVSLPNVARTEFYREGRSTWKVRSLFKCAGKLGWSVYDNVSRKNSELWLGGKRIASEPCETIVPAQVLDDDGLLHFAQEGTKSSAIAMKKDGSLVRLKTPPHFFGGCVLVKDGIAWHFTGKAYTDQVMWRPDTGEIKATGVNSFILSAIQDGSKVWLAGNDGAENGLHRLPDGFRKTGSAHYVARIAGTLYGALNNEIYKLGSTGASRVIALPVKEVQQMAEYKGVIIAACSGPDSIWAISGSKKKMLAEAKDDGQTGSLFDNVVLVDGDDIWWGRAEGTRFVLERLVVK